VPQYLINGMTVNAAAPLSDDEIDEIATQHGSSPQPQQPAAAQPQADPNAPLSGIAGNAMRGLIYGGATAGNSLIRAAGAGASALGMNNVGNSLSDFAAQEQPKIAKTAPTVDSHTQINSPSDAAKYVTGKLGEAVPGIAEYFAGGVPAMAGAGAIQGAQGASDATGGDTMSTIAGAGAGAATSVLPVPFARGAGGVVSGALRTGLGMAATSPITAAANRIPLAVHSGNIGDVVPSGSDIAEQALSGAIQGGAFGAAGHGTAGPERIAAPEGPQGIADRNLQARISGEAQNLGADLNNVKYGAHNGAENVAENVHNSIATDLKNLRDPLTTQLDPKQAQTFDDLLNRSAAMASFRDARNKVKSTVSDADLDRLQNMVGHTAEGQQIIDLMRQSNTLTSLFRQGMKGGVSRFTDYANPLVRGGSEAGGVSGLMRDPTRIGEAALMYMHPGTILPGLGVWGAGRAIDAMTGNRSRLAKFVRDNAGPAVDVVRGLPSALEANNARDAADEQFKNDRSMADYENRDRDQAYNSQFRQAQYDNQQRDNAARNQRQMADYENAQMNAADRQTRQMADYENRDADTAARSTRRSAEFENFDRDAAYRQSRAEAEAANASQDQAFRTQYGNARLDNAQANTDARAVAAAQAGPAPFHDYVEQNTGLPFEEQKAALAKLVDGGQVTQDEANRFVTAPKTLMRNNRGNRIMDMMGRKPAAAPEVSPNAPQSANIRNPIAYAATARANQARATAAAERIANNPAIDPVSKQIIGKAITKIANTSDRAEALDVASKAISGVPSEVARNAARTELTPLVEQIKPKAEPLKTEAVKRDANGRPLQRVPLKSGGADKIINTISQAMPKRIQPGDRGEAFFTKGNPVTRTMAAIYRATNKITKPAYDGPKEPNEAFLRRVADFHDQAVHDPNNTAVKKSYDSLIKQTVKQYKALGDLKVETWRGTGEPYKNSTEMLRDVSNNKHLWFLPTDNASGEGDAALAHPMLRDTGLKTVDGHKLVANDVFRIVHDFFGHTQNGFQFGPKGEYNAFREHAQMYSDEAIPALAAETLAQNAWVNFGPHMRDTDGSLKSVPQAQRPFSEQKAYAFPADILNSDPQARGAPLMRATGGAEGKRLGTTGQYIGAPRGVDSPQKLAALRKSLEGLSREGEPGRFWYENSSRAILNAVHGDKDEADKLAQLIAVFSPQTKVAPNLTHALAAYADAKAGRPIRQGYFTAAMSKKAEAVMRGEAFEGRKTNNFYVNLMRIIDPSRVQGVTQDVWMMRAFGYDTGHPTQAQYDFAQKEAMRLADKLGWEPQQVQAAIWVAAKAHQEGTAIDVSKGDFADALHSNLAQISWESTPGRTSGVLPEMHDAPIEQRAEYHQAISQAFLNDKGHDELAKALNVLSPGEFEAPGYFEGKTNPGSQVLASAPRAFKGAPYGEINKSARENIEAYTIAKGILLKQDAMAWHRPFFNAKVKDQNGVEVRLGRTLTPEETKKLAEALSSQAGSDMAPIGSLQGARFLHFGEFGDAKSFHKAVATAVDTVFPGNDNVEVGKFAFDGNLISNDWSEHSHGEDYLSHIAEGRPDLQRAVRDIVAKIQPRIDATNETFSAKYGWSKPTL
jgi:hypothetical protein